MTPFMNIQSTSDVSLERLKAEAERLPFEWHPQVDEGQVFMRALEVPSWVSVLANAPWWTQFLGAAAAVYVHGIISEAGKETWKNRGRLAQAARRLPSAISTLAEFLLACCQATSDRTFATLAIPLPNGFTEVHLRLDYANQDELEFEIALFVHYVPSIEALIERHALQGNRAVGGITLEFGQSDFSLCASWLDRESLEKCQEVLSFERAL